VPDKVPYWPSLRELAVEIETAERLRRVEPRRVRACLRRRREGEKAVAGHDERLKFVANEAEPDRI
jgi:hypothetical protein